MAARRRVASARELLHVPAYLAENGVGKLIKMATELGRGKRRLRLGARAELRVERDVIDADARANEASMRQLVEEYVTALRALNDR